jgi:hypothetical protein
MTGQDEATRQIRPVERHGEEEAQRRNRAVDGGRLHAALDLMDLEAADVLGRRRIRRPLEEGGEAPDEADVIALRLFPQATPGHVFEHAPTQQCDGRLDRLIGHRVSLPS